MPIRRVVTRMVSVAAMVLAAGLVAAQNYPSKPIRIVTSEPGGGLDYASRLIAQGISGPLGQQVVVENRPIVAIGITVSNASPDGYTLLLAGTTFVIAPLLQKTPYHPLRDFSPITLAARQINILVVTPSLPVNSVKELIALAKAKPGTLNYGASGTGSTPHLAAELFKSMGEVNIERINYKGTGPAVTALIGGEVQVMITSTASVAPHVKSGKLKALAVTSAEPSALAPGLPTVAASGLPDFEAITIQGIFAPAKTPETVINRLNQEIARVLNRPEVKEQLLRSGVETVASSPEQLMAMMKAEMSRLGKVIKDAGIRAE